MKDFLNILKYSLFLSLVVTLVSCGGSDDPVDEDTTLEDALSNLVGSTSFNSVVVPDGASAELDWSNMTLEFSGTVDGGDYVTTNSANTTVWPATGTWEFTDNTGTKVTRDDGVVVTLGLGSQLETTFTINTSGSRVKVVEGEWQFTFDFD